MSFFQSTALKQLKKTAVERAMDEDDAAKKEAAVKYIAKRVTNNTMLSNLNEALQQRNKDTSCVLVKKVEENKRKSSPDNGSTHLYICKAFRFEWLRSVNDIRPLKNCSTPFNKRADIYCVNPFHYNPHRGKVPPVEVERNKFPFPDHGFGDPSDPVYDNMMPYIPNHAFSPDMPAIGERMDEGEDSMCSVDSNISDDIEMEDVSAEIRENPDKPGNFIVPFDHEEIWMKLSYGEGDTMIAKVLEIGGYQFVINASTNPSDEEQLNVGYMTGVERMRDRKLEEVRRAIGQGVRIFTTGGDIFLEVHSNYPIFIQAPSANRRFGKESAAVIKVEPKTSIKVFCTAEFSAELATATNLGYEATYALNRLCQFRASFVKGWGHEYSRKSLKQTGCWFIAQFPGPSKWIERVIERMGAPPQFCGSVT